MLIYRQEKYNKCEDFGKINIQRNYILSIAVHKPDDEQGMVSIMKVKVDTLTEGVRLVNDVMGKTTEPIVPRNTIVTKKIIEVLQAFSIEEVDVEQVSPVDSYRKEDSLKPSERISPDSEIESPRMENEFLNDYNEAVKLFKKEFKKWQAGINVEIYTIRNSIIELFEQFSKNAQQLVFLHNYGKKEEYFFHHAVATALISGAVARNMHLRKSEINQVILATILSNCGMAKLDPKLLSKEKWTDVDKKEYLKHPGMSYKMVEHIPSLSTAAKLAILQHEEREDGTGFPFGEQSKKIHPFAKIIACSDLYYQIVWNPFSFEKKTSFAAIDQLEYESFGKYDIHTVKALIECIAKYAIELDVQLSNGITGKIVYVDSNHPSRPVIKLEGSGQIISLMDHPETTIKAVFM